MNKMNLKEILGEAKYNQLVSYSHILRVSEEDIDLFMKDSELINFFSFNDFFIEEKEEGRFEVKKYIDDKLFNFDVISDFSYLSKYFGKDYGNIKINIDKYLSDNDYKEKIDNIRYSLLLRENKNEYIKTSKYSLKKIYENFLHLDYPFRKNNPKLSKNIFTNFLQLKPKYFLVFLKNRWKEIKNTIGRGKIICLTGPDGSGKTTISNRLIKDGIFQKYKYMWTKIKDKDDFIGKIIKGIGLLIIPYFKYISIKKDTFLGRNVIVERWPSFEWYFLYKKNNSKLIKMIYYLNKFLFPSPPVDSFILEVTGEEILNRKKELTLKEIKIQYEIYKDLMLHFKNINSMNNGNITKSLNNILSVFQNQEE